MEETESETINILGYSGQTLSEQFETLSQMGFKGNVIIIRNEKIRRSVAPFKTSFNFKEIMFDNCTNISPKNLLLCSNKPATKKFIYDFYNELWDISFLNFTSIIHPTSVIASSVTLNKGIHIEALSRIGAYSDIGFGVNIHSNCSIGHHNIINQFSTIEPGVNMAGKVEIGEGTTVGPGSTIFHNIKIGSNSIIGGGSVVTKNIPSNTLAYGNPIKIIKKINF